MAVPKRKTSRSNTRHRRANWTASPGQLVRVEGSPVPVPQRLVRAVQRGLITPEER